MAIRDAVAAGDMATARTATETLSQLLAPPPSVAPAPVLDLNAHRKRGS